MKADEQCHFPLVEKLVFNELIQAVYEARSDAIRLGLIAVVLAAVAIIEAAMLLGIW